MPRRPPKGLLKLPYSKREFAKVRQRLGLKTARDLAKVGKLFRSVEQPISPTGFAPSKKNGHSVFEPSFTKVHPANVKRSYDAAKRSGESLYQIRDGKIRTFRSAAYQRQAHARLLNMKLRPMALERERLQRKLNQMQEDIPLNQFDSVEEMKDSVPAIQAAARMRVQLAQIGIRILQKKLDYYDRFPTRKSEHIRNRLDINLVDLEAAKVRFERQEKASHELMGDIRLYSKDLNAISRAAMEATLNFQKMGSQMPVNPDRETWVFLMKYLTARKKMYDLRKLRFEQEMKILKLYGIAFKGRTISSIRSDILKCDKEISRMTDEMRHRADEE